MKVIGIVGNNADLSYNRLLLKQMAERYPNLEIEVAEIKAIPLFCEAATEQLPAVVTALAAKIAAADGVIIATPEYDHTIPACLKSTIEWLSCTVHPFTDKPVMIVGASLGPQGTSRAQGHLREILNSPGLGAHVLPGNEFLLNFAKQKFASGAIVEQATLDFMDSCVAHFVNFIQVHTQVQTAIV
ncbi:NADPH-dependent FMN reductase [Loigolactobacillus binensis]|uniref:NADPH-dependent FMN reductase n=1 Tax=Loigolactobacillus binensis TaxID=2559922 RepID=A0ABW3ECD5_9LACO|nr:NADPH-dependent FMN reductase [Loigolactobacillus binensis]